MTDTRALAVAILAAGKGKRMGNPDLAKVLTPLRGKPLLQYVLHTAAELQPARTVVIVGHQRAAVSDFVFSVAPNAVCVVQLEQLGTGHAIQQTEAELGAHEPGTLAPGTMAPGISNYNVLILSGDVPLLSVNTLRAFISHHTSHNAALSVLTTIVDAPTGYGRIVRNVKGAMTRIVEEKDATDDERSIHEINSGIYLVHNDVLFDALDRVKNANAQGEFYLTDIVSILLEDGERVEAFVASDSTEVHGINTLADLEHAAEILTQRSEVW